MFHDLFTLVVHLELGRAGAATGCLLKSLLVSTEGWLGKHRVQVLRLLVLRLLKLLWI